MDTITSLTKEQIEVRDILISVARKGKQIFYSDLVKQAKLPLDMANPYHRSELGHILGAISLYEVQHERYMLSSVAVGASDSNPTDGFYKLAEELRNIKFHNKTEKEDFWIKELNNTYEYWVNK